MYCRSLLCSKVLVGQRHSTYLDDPIATRGPQIGSHEPTHSFIQVFSDAKIQESTINPCFGGNFCAGSILQMISVTPEIHRIHQNRYLRWGIESLMIDIFANFRTSAKAHTFSTFSDSGSSGARISWQSLNSFLRTSHIHVCRQQRTWGIRWNLTYWSDWAKNSNLPNASLINCTIHCLAPNAVWIQHGSEMQWDTWVWVMIGHNVPKYLSIKELTKISGLEGLWSWLLTHTGYCRRSPKTFPGHQLCAPFRWFLSLCRLTASPL